MFATFNNLELKITMPQAKSVAQSGENEPAVQALLKEPSILRQFKKIPPDSIKRELKEYGTWSKEELDDIEQNKGRILWLACWQIVEEFN